MLSYLTFYFRKVDLYTIFELHLITYPNEIINIEFCKVFKWNVVIHTHLGLRLNPLLSMKLMHVFCETDVPVQVNLLVTLKKNKWFWKHIWHSRKADNPTWYVL